MGVGVYKQNGTMYMATQISDALGDNHEFRGYFDER